MRDNRGSACGLQRARLFAGLTADELHALAVPLDARHYLRDEFIFHMGEEARHVYLLESGAVKISRISPGGDEYMLDLHKPGDVFGHFVAINPLTGEKKWEIPLTDLPSSSGMLATGGGLLFTGKLNGEFIALDQDTGKTLWQFQTGSSVNSTAITYTHKGRQYVTIASGLGGILATRYAAGKMPTGGSIWTFALIPE